MDARRRSPLRRSAAVAVAVLALAALGAVAAQRAADDPTRGELRLVLFGDFNGPYGSVDYAPAVALTVRVVGRPAIATKP